MRGLIALVVIAIALASCSESKPPAKTVFDPHVEAIKKARAVEQKVLDAAQLQRDDARRQEAGEK